MRQYEGEEVFEDYKDGDIEQGENG